MCKSTAENPIECKEEQEIKNWLKRKFVLTVYNSKRFVLEEFDENKVKLEARTNWLPVNSQIRVETIFKIHTERLSLKDTVF